MSVVWRSEITAEMVSDLTPEQIQNLSDCLDEAVEIVASDFGVGQ
jgi:Spy/CpxP family protein refolding chaperone